MSSTLLEPKNLPCSVSTQLELNRNWLSVLTFIDSFFFQSLPRVVISTDLFAVPSNGIFVGWYLKNSRQEFLPNIWRNNQTTRRNHMEWTLVLSDNFHVALVMIQFQPNSSLGWHWLLVMSYFWNIYFRQKKLMESI